MRDIEFRVPHYDFNGSFRCFTHWGRIGDGVFASPSQVGKALDAKADEQFTGLYDKNGVKIFEGDIVKFKDDEVFSSTDGFWGATKKPNLGVIFWDAGWTGNPDAKFNCSKIGGNNQPNYWMCKLKEVIGNIHENPELLEAQK